MSPPVPGPTPFGRAIAGILGMSAGTAALYYLLSDYQLIKREPPRIEYDEQGNPIKPRFKVTFRDMKPLEMKPEVVEKIHEHQEALRKKEERIKLEKELLGESENK